jgi:CIC family chloride channel protein
MIFEMTNNYSIILPLMAANITSFAVARRLVREPIYDALLEQDGIHLPKPGGHHLRRLRVGSAMSRSFVALDARSSTAGALLVVRASDRPGDAHPLLDADGRFVGMVSRRELERAEREGRGEEPVLGLARAPSIALHADQSVDAALAALGRQQSAEMPVVSRRDSGRLVGIVTLGDVAAAVARAEDRAG